MTEEGEAGPGLGKRRPFPGGLKSVSASPTQPRTQSPSTLALPHSEHGLCLLPNAIQVHVGSCAEQEGQRGAGGVHVQERWGTQE